MSAEKQFAAELPSWDLEKLYPDNDAWEKDFARIEPLMKKFAAWKGHLADSPAALKSAIEAQDECDRLTEKVYCYAHLRSDEDTSNNANHERVDRVESLLASLTPLEAWFAPEMMAIPDRRMEELVNDPELELYRRSILELLSPGVTRIRLEHYGRSDLSPVCYISRAK